jgi:nucleotide-binding universal stress UspA family protein
MPQKILIPLDGSKLGETALHHIEKLVSALSAEQKVEVTLLQVLKPPTRLMEKLSDVAGNVELPLTEEEMEPVKKQALHYLNRAGRHLRSKGVAVTCSVVVDRTGRSSAEEIIKAEAAINADLVAMSTHGRHGVSRWIFGSVTQKVLEAGKMPVLIVRAEENM